ncbi:MAG: DNA methyltransferase, partial [Geminicoccaceae bacterium]
SVRDRPSAAHEKVFLLAKSQRYFYDVEAVRQSYAEASAARYNSEFRADLVSQMVATSPAVGAGRISQNPAGRSLRNYEPVPLELWEIATAPFPEAHFATFPPELARCCILAGTSEKGCCAACGAPWAHEIERTATAYNEKEGQQQKLRCAGVISGGTQKVTLGVTDKVIRKTHGWSPSCACKPELDGGSPQSCTVLDPFAGAGTTGLVADRLGRDAVLIELNPDYAKMAKRRIEADAGMFAAVEIEPAGDKINAKEETADRPECRSP